ncbi:twin-arginine translocation pathway signal protein [Paucibacter sp. B2R-40]|uniref:Acg family FMN-binding oxidoreductase n=1 Tax=Paucibacter sp. B2R-40 TaxID=2893554 RepID=UPI0021E43853|nr:twin-arginine translocation pathway signal protein [Paucibacter sp. B2R-40]MCV2355697.1 twin-arginine translocation pathway signal protein [Paucibacter sp. B2R-40]
MKRRSFMRVLAAGGAVIALPGCDQMPPSATAPWTAPGASQTDLRLRALSWALLAPNPHNLQSWVADIREPGLIRLSVDLQRLLPASDPPNRQVLIGCGAFLELLCQAAAQQGQRAEVTLLPEGEYVADGVDARPFATVRLTADASVPPDPLFAAVPLRRTNRAPFTAQVPDAQALAQLAEAAGRPGITLHSSTDAAKVQRLRELAIAGYRVEFGNAATWAESAKLMRVGAAAVAAEPSGVAVTGTMAWFGRQLGMLGPEALRKTDGVAARTAINSSAEAAAHTHAWAWLSSADNSRRTQIEAGRAYLRTDLAAAQLGLAIHPNSQVLQEFEAMSALYDRFHAVVGVAQPARVQMFVRLGYAARPEPAPRRPLSRLVHT